MLFNMLFTTEDADEATPHHLGKIVEDKSFLRSDKKDFLSRCMARGVMPLFSFGIVLVLILLGSFGDTK